MIKAWASYYRRQGWHKIAAFNYKGHIGVPYALFKAKNITDPTVRENKWSKARPISPTFHHPMHRLLSLVGKAWYFVARKMSGEHFIIDSTRDVPQFLENARSKFGGEGFQAHVLDIEGCYPNMPKDKIEHAMLQLVQEARRDGHTGVSVPMRAKKLKCSWKEVGGGFKWIPFEVMLGMLDFSLNNAIARLKDGRLVRQLKGIPMGDALSPGMTIGTCGWMEREWMNTLDEHTKKKFRAKRYMDDILLLLNKQGWDYERFYKDFKESHCYMYPLK